MSQGAFDITVKPLVDLFEEKLGGKNQLFPTQKEMKQALNLVGSQKIRLDERKMFFQKPGMGITLDGIAKGYVVDRVSQLFSKHKIENHLINAGGDIRTSGAKGDNRPWKVAIEDPSKTKNYPDIIHRGSQFRALPRFKKQCFREGRNNNGSGCPFNQCLRDEPRKRNRVYECSPPV
jgi:thiamine biosynthesis lipoprotein